MSGMLLSCADWPIIAQVADLLGLIMSGIYSLFDAIGIANIGLCIIVFTILVRLLMIPMSIKQQKNMKLTTLINPEVQAIQKKYKNRRDNDSMMAMNAETKAVYEKYGTSPSGGCLPMLIQMPILLALYGVISSIPTHVSAVGEVYQDASNYIYESMDEYSDLSILNNVMISNKISGFEADKDYDKIVEVYYDESLKNLEDNKDNINELLSDAYARSNSDLMSIESSKDAWGDAEILKNKSLEIASALKNVSAEDWAKVAEYLESDSNHDLSATELVTISEYIKAADTYDYDNIIKTINDNYNEMDSIHDEVIDKYLFLGIDLSRSPSQEMEEGIWWALAIPVLSAILQWLTAFISSKNNQAMADNPMASSLKFMNIFLPLMSAFFCYSFAAGLGLYWVIGSLIQIVQQVIINSYFNKMTVDDIIKSNIQKINRKRAKRGLPPQKISAAANTNVKNIKYNENKDDKKPNTSAGVTYKKGGIAAKANMVKEYNDKKNK